MLTVAPMILALTAAAVPAASAAQDAKRPPAPRVCLASPAPASGSETAAAGAAGAPARGTIAQLGWLAGTWTGASGPMTFEERWTPAAGGSMLAVARTLKGGHMVAFEFLCIVERGGGLVYTAMPNARTPATDFVLSAIDASSATFENPAHDFPKKIRYALRADGMLEAVISGDGGQRAQTFVFKKVDQ